MRTLFTLYAVIFISLLSGISAEHRMLTTGVFADNQNCNTCLSTSSEYWGASSPTSNYGYCGNDSDDLDTGAGQTLSGYLGSNDTANVFENSIYALCPVDSDACGSDYNLKVNDDGDSQTFTTDALDTNTTCKYMAYIDDSQNDVKEATAKIKVLEIDQAEVYVYVFDTNSETFIEVGTIIEINDSLEGDIDKTNDVYVIVKPTASGGSAQIKIYTDKTTDRWTWGMKYISLTVILMVLIVGILLILSLLGYRMVRKYKIRQQEREAEQNSQQDNEVDPRRVYQETPRVRAYVINQNPNRQVYSNNSDKRNLAF